MTPNQKLSIEYWPLDRIKPYPKNARKIPESAVEKVAASIREFGWRQPIVVDEHGVIVVGRARLKAAYKLELSQAPVHIATDLTPAQIRQYRLMDNRSHDEAKWDLEVLELEMNELQALDLDMSLTGFSPTELDRFRPPVASEDELPAGVIVPVTRPGDLWVCGEHRVLCGDCTVRGDVERLMGGERDGLMATDPPYGVGYANDERPNPGVAKPRVAKPRVAKPRVPDASDSASRACGR